MRVVCPAGAYAYQLERPENLTDIQRAARLYCLQKQEFGGKVSGQDFGYVASGSGSGPRLSLLRIEEELSAVHVRLANVIVEHLHWHDCLQRCDRPATRTTGRPRATASASPSASTSAWQI